MESKVRLTFIACVMLFQVSVARSDISSHTCHIDDFSDSSTTMPAFDSQSAVGFRAGSGQSGELQVFKKNGKIVSLSTKYLTDESGLIIRFISAGSKGMIAEAMVPDEPDTTFIFVLCPDGTIGPDHSPSDLFTDSEFQEMARAVTSDFLNNATIEPYRREFQN